MENRGEAGRAPIAAAVTGTCGLTHAEELPPTVSPHRNMRRSALAARFARPSILWLRPGIPSLHSRKSAVDDISRFWYKWAGANFPHHRHTGGKSDARPFSGYCRWATRKCARGKFTFRDGRPGISRPARALLDMQSRPEVHDRKVRLPRRRLRSVAWAVQAFPTRHPRWGIARMWIAKAVLSRAVSPARSAMFTMGPGNNDGGARPAGWDAGRRHEGDRFHIARLRRRQHDGHTGYLWGRRGSHINIVARDSVRKKENTTDRNQPPRTPPHPHL